ncbi:MAG: hypothetical protein ABUK06_04805, partial [Dehalococcoidales bacterium]
GDHLNPIQVRYLAALRPAASTMVAQWLGEGKLEKGVSVDDIKMNMLKLYQGEGIRNDRQEVTPHACSRSPQEGPQGAVGH